LNVAEEDPADANRRSNGGPAARSEEKLSRIEHAQAEMEEMQQKYRKRSGEKGAANLAHRRPTPMRGALKMADGGTRPAMNVQFASDGDAQMIVAVDVTSQASDNGLMARCSQDSSRLQRAPASTSSMAASTIARTSPNWRPAGTQFTPAASDRSNCRRARPVCRQGARQRGNDRIPRADGYTEAKEVYKRRSAIAEFSHADCRNRGLTQFRVRGLLKAKAQTLVARPGLQLRRMLNLGLSGGGNGRFEGERRRQPNERSVEFARFIPDQKPVQAPPQM